MPANPSHPRMLGVSSFLGVSVDLWHLYPEDLIPASAAAEIAGVTEAAIRKMASRGTIHRFPGRRRSEGTLYARPEVEAVVAARTNTQAA